MLINANSFQIEIQKHNENKLVKKSSDITNTPVLVSQDGGGCCCFIF